MAIINGATVLLPSEYVAEQRTDEPIVFGPEATGGTYRVLIGMLPPHEAAIPLHIHPHTDEAFYFADGEATFQFGDRIMQAPAGTFVFVPRGVIHTVWNAADKPIHGILILSPGEAKHVYEIATE